MLFVQFSNKIHMYIHCTNINLKLGLNSTKDIFGGSKCLILISIILKITLFKIALKIICNFRVTNGQNADVGEWPWIAALLMNGRQFCGASLIDDKHILTAAHCVAQ